MYGIREIVTDNLNMADTGNGLYDNRRAFVDTENGIEVTIIVQAYNKVEKTKRCVESILKYTTEIDYDLILIDNGSTDNTFEYFKSVPYEKKKVLRLTKNLGSPFPGQYLSLSELGRFVCSVQSDLIMTENWLSNLLTCIKSDERIGLVNAMSSNVSNLQGIDFPYKDYAEMQEKARVFNVSEPRKWQDRMRMIMLGSVVRKEVLLAIGWPMLDPGFAHDFGDDDTSFIIRRAGYRTVLAGDTWICHDHDWSHMEGKDPKKFQESLEIGRENFKEKYMGVDAWEDCNNYYIPYMQNFPNVNKEKDISVLGVDVRCGTPILDLKNRLGLAGKEDVVLSAFVEDAKYWLDLKTICRDVVCDRVEYLHERYSPNSFDYIIADKPLNLYADGLALLDKLLGILAVNGTIIFKLRNTHSILDQLYCLGEYGTFTRDCAQSISVEYLMERIGGRGVIYNGQIIPIKHEISVDDGFFDQIIPKTISGKKRDEVINKLMIKDYMFIFTKKY